MGGHGSGTYCRWSTQTTIEETKRVDIRYMRKQGMLTPGCSGSLYWNRGGEPTGNIRFSCFTDYLRLDFRFRYHGEDDWQTIEQKITFDRTACHYGGKRLWFLCPGCHRRVAVLCSDGPLFLCRHCYRLPYGSQNEDVLDRLVRRKDKLGKRIFRHYDCGEGWSKKKGLHWRTYNRLLTEYERLDDLWNQNFLSRLSNLYLS